MINVKQNLVDFKMWGVRCESDPDHIAFYFKTRPEPGGRLVSDDVYYSNGNHPDPLSDPRCQECGWRFRAISLDSFEQVDPPEVIVKVLDKERAIAAKKKQFEEIQDTGWLDGIPF